MAEFSREQIIGLARQAPGFCISIYMPTHRAGADTQQNPVRLKNNIREVERKLEQQHAIKSEQQRSELVKPFRALLDDGQFWRHQQDGLALLVDSQGTLHDFRLPIDFAETTVIGPHFHLRPLLQASDSDMSFYILAAGRNSMRLIECTRYSAREVEWNVPQVVDVGFEIPNIDREMLPQVVLQKHGANLPSPLQGDIDTNRLQDERLVHYFRRVDDEAKRHITGSAPLVFAGEIPLFSYYRQANTYAGLLDEFVVGNPEGLLPPALHERAWPFIHARVEKQREALIERFGVALGHQRGSVDLEDILRGARISRVDTLLLSTREIPLGRFDDERQVLTESRGEDEGAEDLGNLAAILTLQTGGEVRFAEPAHMPAGAAAAAIYRF